MTRVAVSQPGLRRLVGRTPDAHALVSSLVEALGEPVAIEDAVGRLLHGEPVTGAERVAITRGGARIGYVRGGREAGKRSEERRVGTEWLARCRSRWSP